MAKKKLNPLEDPPKSSDDEVESLSGEGEEEISDDSSSEEDDDDLMNTVVIVPPPATKPKTPVRHAVASGSKNPTAVTVASPPKPGSKRPSEKISPRKVHAKRSKKIPEESAKKPLFQRLWSEEDEISLLQGMIDFKFETEKSPYEDMDEFYEYIKKSISFEASKAQAVEKIRSLKKKYTKKVLKGVESMPKAHDMEWFKLSKYIWGSNGLALTTNVKKSEQKSDGSLKKKLHSLEANGENVEEEDDRDVLDDGEKEEDEDRDVMVNGNKDEDDDREVLDDGNKVQQVDKKVLVTGDSKSLGVMRASDWFEDSLLVGSIASLGVGERFVKQKWSMVASETKKKLQDKWKLLQAKEMELVLQKTDFMREVGSVIAEAS